MALRILVAEDEYITGFDLCDTFEEAGYEVEGPHAGMCSAMLACQKERPDLALLDIELADGLSLELAQKLLEQAALEYIERQDRFRRSMEKRIAQGFSARGDLPRIDSSIANVRTRLASFRRDRASAEAQYLSLTGHDAPAALARAPLPRIDVEAPDMLEDIVMRSPIVMRADATTPWQRLLYNGLHSLDFAPLLARPALRTGLIVGLSLLGVALCITSCVVAWRVLVPRRRRAARSSAATVRAAEGAWTA